MRNIFLFALVLFSLVLFGCVNTSFGLKSEPSCSKPVKDEVDGKDRARTAEENVLCLHEAAISAAYVAPDDAGRRNAVGICLKLIAVPNLNDDELKFAETQRNNCLTDVATILRDESVCQLINQNIADGNGATKQRLRGDETQRKICESKAINRKTTDASNYSCPLLFSALFAGMFGYAFFARKR